MAGQRPETPCTLIRPVILSAPRSPEAQAEERRRRTHAWEAWDAAVRFVPAARAELRWIEEEGLPSIEREIVQADAGLDAARAALFARRARELGNTVPEVEGLPALMFDHEEEDADPGIVAARANRTKWIVGRGRLWDRRQELGRLISHAEHQMPPGERPRD